MSDAFDVVAPELKTARLRLCPLSVDDAPAIYAYTSDAEVARFTLWAAHPNEDFTRGFLATLIGPAVLAWSVALDEPHTIIGMIFLHSLSRQHRKAELAFSLRRSFWRRGITTEAAAEVLKFAFGELNLNRAEATCMRGNHGSRRVLEKLGMSLEGTMRRSHFRYDGFHDMDLFSILRDENRG